MTLGGEEWEEWDLASRKEGRAERKRISAKDRSKYKKTDQEKYLQSIAKDHEAKVSKKEWLEGRVLSILPQGIIVDYNGEQICCVLKGLMKRDRTHAKNLVTVGDFVLFEITAPAEGIIASVKPRRSILSRADNLSRRKEQLIAANIDQVIITGSVVDPPLKPSLIDRYIIAARKGGMEPIIIINKIDLLDGQEDEQELYEEMKKAYHVDHIPVLGVSTVTGKGIDQLKAVMSGKASVFSGQSGVGKSSLINSVTGESLAVGKTVDKTGKGAHTTTSAKLVPLEQGGWCIDTPGIKSFGIWDLDLDEVEGYFPEIHECGLDCKFPDCSHSHEDRCAVITAVEEGRISPVRYDSYQALRASVQQKHQRR